MGKIQKLFLPFFICSCLYACGFVKDEQIIGKYHIVATDVSDEACLGYEVDGQNYICLVPAKILSYCKNEKYIIAKQTLGKKIAPATINYYIIPILKSDPEVFPENLIIGPLSDQEFKEESAKLNLGRLRFKNID